MNEVTLRDLLVVMTTTGAAVVAYWIMGHVPRLSALPPEYKRWCAFALTSLFAVGAWALQIVFLYASQPEGWRAWVEGAVAVAGAAIVQGQLIHGARDLRRRQA
jgi:hypothetical protein